MTDKPQDLDKMEPGKEVNDLVAVEIMGWHYEDTPSLKRAKGWWTEDGKFAASSFSPTTDHNDMWKAVKSFGKRFASGFKDAKGDGYWASCWGVSHIVYHAYSEFSACHAGCIVMLKVARAAGEAKP